MKTKPRIALAILALAAGTSFVLTQAAWSNRQKQPLKLEGAWVASVPTTPLGWTYTLAPSDPNGQSAVLQGTIHIPAEPTWGGAFPDAEYLSALVGEAVMTGRNEAAFTVLYYAMKQGAAGPEKVYIGLDSGTIKQTAPGRTEVSHNFGIFLPGQDADGDGLPDEGQSPAVCIPYASLDTRLPLLRPCTPTPAP